MVVPEGLAELFAAAGADFDRDGEQLLQTTLARFIADGHYASHLRVLRQTYAARREQLVRSLYESCPGARRPARACACWAGPGACT
ncbi:MAG: hypothetical protein R3E42_10885 [Burkholderiaceae bacterium]